MAIPRSRPYCGPAIFSYGFRPFFLFGALYAAIVMAIWILLLSGRVETRSQFAPVDWHIHEMLFGYLAAILAGFLLTAIPNWTGRLPLNGVPLVVLTLSWGAGRAAVFFSASLGSTLAATIDCAFLGLLVAAATREIVAGRNWRNLKVLAPVTLFLLANILFHIEVGFYGVSDVSRRLGIAAAILLICIIGGRIIPSFTRNWLAKESPGSMPSPFNRFDVFALVLSGLALAAWVVVPHHILSGLLMAFAACCNLVRLARWRGDRAVADLLVLVLHLAFLWVPTGLLLAGLEALFPGQIASALSVHAFGVGAIGTMTLAVMVRATLGHTGRTLKAGWSGCFVFVAILTAAFTRLAQAVYPTDALLHFSAGAWLAAFMGFVILFGPMLMSRRIA